MRHLARMRYVVLPQAGKIAIAPTVGFLVLLLKSTSLASIIGFVEITRAGQIINNVTFRPFLVFGLVAAIYFLLCWPLSLLSQRPRTTVRHRVAAEPRKQRTSRTDRTLTIARRRSACFPPAARRSGPDRPRGRSVRATPAEAQTIDDVLSKKKLQVGILVDLPPFGVVNAQERVRRLRRRCGAS